MLRTSRHRRQATAAVAGRWRSNGWPLEVFIYRVPTRNLSTYIIPTSLDSPEMHTVTVGVAERSGPWGAKGVGEAAMVPIAPAIALAIRQATGGALMARAPATAERVHAGMGRR